MKILVKFKYLRCLYKCISIWHATLEIMPSILTGIDLSDNTKDYNFQLNEIVFKYKNEKSVKNKIFLKL